MDKKRTLYFDMDNVLVDFQSGIDRLSDEMKKEYERRPDNVPGIFSKEDKKDDAHIFAMHCETPVRDGISVEPVRKQ
jgi:FMN phosphatase YigB (HAD superfamily)